MEISCGMGFPERFAETGIRRGRRQASRNRMSRESSPCRRAVQGPLWGRQGVAHPARNPGHLTLGGGSRQRSGWFPRQTPEKARLQPERTQSPCPAHMIPYFFRPPARQDALQVRLLQRSVGALWAVLTIGDGITCGGIAQLVERLNGIQKVRSSNLLTSTKFPPGTTKAPLVKCRTTFFEGPSLI